MDDERSAELRARLAAMYEAFDRRDIPTVLTALAPDVVWPNGWEGGTVTGHQEVADYWTRQWTELDPRVVPTAFRTEPDGRIAVTVHQVVRTRQGAIVADGTVGHVYRFRGDLVSDMEIRP